jgi:hypothetical protein
MTDRRIRDLERLVAQGQAPRAALLMERVRVGELPVELVRFAVALGNRDAIETGLRPLHMGAVVKTSVSSSSAQFLLLGKAVWAIVEKKYSSFQERKLAAIQILDQIILTATTIGIRSNLPQTFALNIISRYLTTGTTPSRDEMRELLLAQGDFLFDDVIVQTALMTEAVNNADLKASLLHLLNDDWPDQELRGPVTAMCCRILAEAALA